MYPLVEKLLVEMSSSFLSGLQGYTCSLIMKKIK